MNALLKVTMDGRQWRTTADQFMADNAEDLDLVDAVRDLIKVGNLAVEFGGGPQGFVRIERDWHSEGHPIHGRTERPFIARDARAEIAL